jgi:hypothetical protein
MPPERTSGSRMDACRMVEVVGWLGRKPAHPVTIGPCRRHCRTPRIACSPVTARETAGSSSEASHRRPGPLQQPSAAPQPNAASCAAAVPAGSPPITDRAGFTPLVRRTPRPAELRRMRVDGAAVRVPNGPGLHLSVHWGQESPARTGAISSGPIIGGDDDGAGQSFRHARTGREVAAADRGRQGRGTAREPARRARAAVVLAAPNGSGGAVDSTGWVWRLVQLIHR